MMVVLNEVAWSRPSHLVWVAQMPVLVWVAQAPVLVWVAQAPVLVWVAQAPVLVWVAQAPVLVVLVVSEHWDRKPRGRPPVECARGPSGPAGWHAPPPLVWWADAPHALALTV